MQENKFNMINLALARGARFVCTDAVIKPVIDTVYKESFNSDYLVLMPDDMLARIKRVERVGQYGRFMKRTVNVSVWDGAGNVICRSQPIKYSRIANAIMHVRALGAPIPVTWPMDLVHLYDFVADGNAINQLGPSEYRIGDVKLSGAEFVINSDKKTGQAHMAADWWMRSYPMDEYFVELASRILARAWNDNVAEK